MVLILDTVLLLFAYNNPNIMLWVIFNLMSTKYLLNCHTIKENMTALLNKLIVINEYVDKKHYKERIWRSFIF